jgi:hypothetical protein
MEVKGDNEVLPNLFIALIINILALQNLEEKEGLSIGENL